MKNTFRTWCAVALLAAAGTGQAAVGLPNLPTFSGLYVFGDSLSDSGNAAAFGAVNPTQVIGGNTYIPTQAYASNTFSDGPVWTTPFAGALGLSALPSAAGGGIFAVGGTRAATGPFSAVAQIGSLLSAGPLAQDALYVIATGGNDVRTAATAAAAAPGQANAIVGLAAAGFATAVTQMVTTLKTGGARNIVVWNAPDVGSTPAVNALGTPAAQQASQVAGAFNAALSTAFATPTFAGVALFDVFGLVRNVVANPLDYGLDNVTDACGAPSNACSASVETALFWDGIHPTETGHAIIAGGMLQVVAVPEPGTWALFFAGLVGVGAVARRRRAATPAREAVAA